MFYYLILRVPGEDVRLLQTDDLVTALEKRDVLNGIRPGLPCKPLADNCETLVLTEYGRGITMEWNNVEDSERPVYENAE